MNKPNGQFRVANDPDQVEEFVQKLPVRKMFGIGKVSAFILNEAFGISTVKDLYLKRHLLPFAFKKASLENYLHYMIGAGSTVVDGTEDDGIQKSIGNETTIQGLEYYNL